MSEFPVYLFKVSLLLAFSWMVYRLFFRKMTFFRLNRFLLAGSILFSFLVPVIPLHLPGTEWVLPVFDDGPGGLVPNGILDPPPKGEHPVFSLWSALPLVLLSGTLIYLIALILQLLRLRAIRNRAQILRRGGLRLVISETLPSAFTLFGSVYIDRYTYENRLMPVIRHEWVHARQGHSFDLLIVESACALLWFNPFVFLLRKAVRENLEFLADERSCSGSDSMISYLDTLKSELFRSHTIAFASNFKSSTLKKRIMMLTRNRSDKKLRLSYLMILPLWVIILLSFHAGTGQAAPYSGEKVFTVLNTPDNGIPHRFPMDKTYRSSVTWNYGIEAKNPISGELTVHGGVDIAAPMDTKVFATGDGVVAKVTEDEGWGKLLIIKHDDGLSTWYAHLNSFMVKEGDKVQTGQVIGLVGNTGRSTGPHLHYEVRKEGERVDPNAYFGE